MATYYVKNSGSDLLDGQSEANAWASLTKVNATTFTAGDNIYFNRGDTWSGLLEIENSGTSGSRITFGAYGTGAKPIITARGALPGWDTSGNWTNTSGSIWRKTQTAPVSWRGYYRCWLNGAEEMYPEDGTVTSSTKWYHDGTYFYVYSATNPASAFTSIEVSYTIRNAVAVYSNYVTLTNLDVRGGMDAVTAIDAQYLIIDACDIGNSTDRMGFQSENSTNTIIRNCSFDTDYTLFYADFNPTVTEDACSFYEGNSDGVNIYDNTFTNWGHAGVAVFNSSASSDNFKIYNNTFTAPDISYGRAVVVDVVAGEGSGFEIYNNLIYDMPTVNQLNCDGLKFYNNVIDTIRGSSWMSNKPGTGISISGYQPTTAPINMKIYNNVIANTEDYGITFHGNGGAYADKYDNEIINNIFYNCDANTSYALYIEDDVEILDNVFKNNLFYKSGVSDYIFYGHDTANGYPHTVAEFNAENGTASDVISDNIAGDPLFVDAANGDFRLTSSSPARGAGIDVNLTTDKAGRAWADPPSIGAYEYESDPVITNLFIHDIYIV